MAGKKYSYLNLCLVCGEALSTHSTTPCDLSKMEKKLCAFPVEKGGCGELKSIYLFHKSSKQNQRHSWCCSCVKHYAATRQTNTKYLQQRNIKNNKMVCIYILSNPAWPGWLKIGTAEQRKAGWDPVKGRLNNYNGCSPFRDFTLIYSLVHDKAKIIEYKVHQYLMSLCESGVIKCGAVQTHKSTEWFFCELDLAKEVIKKIVAETA